MNLDEIHLVVVVDAEFGDKLRSIPAGTPVWVIGSLQNQATVQALWGERVPVSANSEFTVFDSRPEMCPEDQFLNELDLIDLHHGPFSSNLPYTVIEVFGAKLNEAIRAALGELGFRRFDEMPVGFKATRTETEARMLRD